MRLFFLTLSMAIVCTIAYAQDSTLENSSDSLTEEEHEIVRKRSWARGFTQTLNKLGDPSIGSFFFSDYHHNTDPSKQKKNFILNTTIQPIVGIGGRRWYVKNYVHSLQIVPVVGIRIFQNDSAFQDHSNPVRTPSLTIRLNYFFSHARLWNDRSTYKIYFGISGFHSSNGQDGYEFKVITNPFRDSIINTVNGNFSELGVLEFMTGGMKVSERMLDKRNARDGFMRKLQYDSRSNVKYWKVSYEYHPRKFSSEKFARYNLYGRHRLNVQLGYLFNPLARDMMFSKQRKKWVPLESTFHNREIRRLVINFSYILDGRYNIATDYYYNPNYASFANVSKRMNIDFTWYERIGSVSDFAVFMRVGYYGSDPYNIYFQESLYVARFGIAFGNFVFGEKRSD